jgi:nucleoside-diphosphate-sugar epimerase
MEIVVTGSAGFIGSNLVKVLASQNHKVTCIDALIDTTYPRDIKLSRWIELKENPNLTLIEKDMRDGNLESYIEDAEVIFNLAAMPGLVDSWANFDLYASCNLTATHRLLDAHSRLKSKAKLIHISTSSVYGKIATVDESGPTLPCSPYGVTKFASENLIKAYADNTSLDFNILRYFSVYGPGQRPDMAYSKFISAIYNDEIINLYGDGSQSRTNTYISDCINATLLIVENGKRNEIYNVSGSELVDMLKVISFLEEIIGKKARVNFMPGRIGDQLITKGEIKKLISDTGFEPAVGFYQGLKNQVDYFLDSINPKIKL